MSISPSLRISSTSWEEYRRNWGWLLGLGVVAILLGLLAFVDSLAVTVVSMILFGWVFVTFAIIEGVQTFRHRRNWHLLLHTLNAALSFVVGLMLLRHPLAGALVMTLLLAAYFTVGGIFRIIAALGLRTPYWGWSLASGIVTLILGILVWDQWPTSGLWVIGLYIGIHLIFSGWADVFLALALRRLPLESR